MTCFIVQLLLNQITCFEDAHWANLCYWTSLFVILVFSHRKYFFVTSHYRWRYKKSFYLYADTTPNSNAWLQVSHEEVWLDKLGLAGTMWNWTCLERKCKHSQPIWLVHLNPDSEDKQTFILHICHWKHGDDKHRLRHQDLNIMRLCVGLSHIKNSLL